VALSGNAARGLVPPPRRASVKDLPSIASTGSLRPACHAVDQGGRRRRRRHRPRRAGLSPATSTLDAYCEARAVLASLVSASATT